MAIRGVRARMGDKRVKAMLLLPAEAVRSVAARGDDLDLVVMPPSRGSPETASNAALLSNWCTPQRIAEPPS
jgi:hypothetical protein